VPTAGASERDPAVAGPLGGLLLSTMRANSPMLVLRAVRWWKDLARLGVRLPLFAVHDFGLCYALPRDAVEPSAHPSADAVVARSPALPGLLRGYRETVAELSRSDACMRARSMKLGDDLVVVVLAHILAPLMKRGESSAPWPESMPLDPQLLRDLDAHLPRLFVALPRAHEQDVLERISARRLQLLTLADALDLDTLRLLRMLGSESTAAGALAHVDMLFALSSPATNNVVKFSLELLPQVLETSRVTAAGVHAVHGYKGVGRKGSMDSMVLTEIAWDAEELFRRLADGELLFYTREQAPEEARRLHQIVIDASASMTGEREVFARGLAIALGKKLQLAGEEVWLRFFDSRLYEPRRARDHGLPVAWLLSFKGERGRNPARVFDRLVTETTLLAARDRRQPVIHLITHAALRVPRSLVQELRRQAHLFGVFILPSGGKVDLDWLDLLEKHAIIDHTTLEKRSARAAAAASIVRNATS
jgi:hypothetical protein